jgi:uncharacterized phage protein gp47/JayE
VITIKSFSEIYNALKQNFLERTNVDVAPRSTIDMFFKAVSDMIHQVYNVIEENKKPYLFTNQKGEELDATGYFLQCPREEEESDSNYLYRLSNWTQRNAACNQQAILDKCKELKYSSSQNYVPYTKGVGTATIYVIPLDYSDGAISRALIEAQEKVSPVLSPSSIVNFEVPEPKYIKIVSYLDVKVNSDKENIKRLIQDQVKQYINSIAPGNSLYLGQINNIGLDTENVEYFNVVQIFANDEEITDFEILQTITAKFLFDQIIFWEVEN